MELLTQIEESKKAITAKCDLTPKTGIILGTGLGSLANLIEEQTCIPYEDIPHFVTSTVEGHSGKLILGTLSGKPVVAMQGRFHFYEGYSMQEITFPVRVMKALGIETLIVSNACGGLNHQFLPGDIMVITDHINLLGQNPLIGKNYHKLGPRFPDMCEPYTKEYITKITAIALEKGIPIQKGVYACMSGPCLETAAEYRMLKIIGADVIGMSTVPEVITAVHARLKVVGLSVITDACLPDALEPVDIDRIIATAAKAEPNLVTLIKTFVKENG
ncbi:MAG: purine-nucleoside phosphorylase [Fibrobacteria bacterium]|nr:purine-nucleoside phosphorylase [Fibrobacteria bacterium]